MSLSGGEASIALWGGIEATVNRVGDVFHSQLERSGHDLRAGDIERCISLGIRALRYPILWERVDPGTRDAPSWWSSDRALPLLQRGGVNVIAGLLHHGSGPAHTSLVDREFPEKFARYARMVAQRYPWIDAYTPIISLGARMLVKIVGNFYSTPPAIDAPARAFGPLLALQRCCNGSGLDFAYVNAMRLRSGHRCSPPRLHPFQISRESN